MSDSARIVDELPTDLWVMYWRVEVRFPFDFDSYLARTRELEGVAGREASDGGTNGFTRDTGWVCETVSEAVGIALKLKPEMRPASWPGLPGEGEHVCIQGFFR